MCLQNAPNFDVIGAYFQTTGAVFGSYGWWICEANVFPPLNFTLFSLWESMVPLRSLRFLVQIFVEFDNRCDSVARCINRISWQFICFHLQPVVTAWWWSIWEWFKPQKRCLKYAHLQFTAMVHTNTTINTNLHSRTCNPHNLCSTDTPTHDTDTMTQKYSKIGGHDVLGGTC